MMERMGEMRSTFIVDVTLVKISVKASEDPNNIATVCPSYTTPWHYPKDSASYHRNIYTAILTVALFTAAKK